MGRFTRHVAGMLRSFDESSSVAIFDQRYSVVSTITAGTPINLPGGGSFSVISAQTSMNVFLNGSRLEYSIDFATSGGGPNYTAITLTFDVFSPDYLDFRIERNT